MTEYEMIVFKTAAGAFKAIKPDILINHSRMSAKVGQNGCVKIVRDPEGGFDLYGELELEHFWVSNANVLWGRKLVNTHPDLTGVSEQGAPVVESKPVTLKNPQELAPVEAVSDSTPVDYEQRIAEYLPLMTSAPDKVDSLTKFAINHDLEPIEPPVAPGMMRLRDQNDPTNFKDVPEPTPIPMTPELEEIVKQLAAPTPKKRGRPKKT